MKFMLRGTADTPNGVYNSSCNYITSLFKRTSYLFVYIESEDGFMAFGFDCDSYTNKCICVSDYFSSDWPFTFNVVLFP